MKVLLVAALLVLLSGSANAQSYPPYPPRMETTKQMRSYEREPQLLTRNTGTSGALILGGISVVLLLGVSVYFGARNGEFGRRRPE